jgi:NADH:ubiquinone oxidoreductase subunit 4 (subunit M)
MDFIASHLLTIILFFPALAAILILFLPRTEESFIRWVALVASLVPLGLSLYLWFAFDAGQPVSNSKNSSSGIRRSIPLTTRVWMASP